MFYGVKTSSQEIDGFANYLFSNKKRSISTLGIFFYFSITWHFPIFKDICLGFSRSQNYLVYLMNSKQHYKSAYKCEGIGKNDLLSSQRAFWFAPINIHSDPANI